jgi:hypothetical protein
VIDTDALLRPLHDAQTEWFNAVCRWVDPRDLTHLEHRCYRGVMREEIVLRGQILGTFEWKVDYPRITVTATAPKPRQ